MERAEIFQSVVKGSNFFTPIVDSYHTIGNRKVRIKAIKRGDTIVDRTILETKSKYPINTFENESSKEVSK